MFINCHIEQQMYFIYLPRWHPKIYNMAKMSQYLQTSWIPGLLAIIGFPGTLAQECCYFIADIILVLPECQHHLVWVYLRPYTFWRSYDRLSHYLHTDDCCDARYSYCYHSQHPAIYIQYCEPGHVVIT